MSKDLGKVSMVSRGAYSEATEYEALDIVTYNGSTYCAKQATTGHAPTETDYWFEVAKGAYQAAVTAGYTGTEAEFNAELVEYATLSADCVRKTTIETIEYDGAVDGKPVAELKVALNQEITNRENADTTLQENIDKKADKKHTHTKSDITDFAHTHTKSEITDFEHTHDDRYYTEEEMDSKLSGKQDTISDLSTIRSNANAGAALVGNVSYYTVTGTV